MNVSIIALSFSQSCYWFAVLIGVSLSSIIGIQLAPYSSLATLPYGLVSLGALIATYKLSIFMQQHGRRKGLRLGAIAGAISGLLCMLAILQESFYLFCLANFLMGIYQASSVFYRLAAIDETPIGQHGRVMGLVLSGSLLAAVLGPSLAMQANQWIKQPAYLGAYLMLTVFTIIAYFLLGKLNVQVIAQPIIKSASSRFIKHSGFLIGVFNTTFTQFVMVLMMVVTPLAMHSGHHSTNQGISVIGWHIIGMFLPSFFSGKLIDRFGTKSITITGLCILSLSAMMAILGMELINYYVSLFLLGMGWNFMYMAGTAQYTKSIEPIEKGKAQGVSEVIIALSSIIAVISGGVLINWFDWQQINQCVLLILACILLLNLWFKD
ncbi:MFS transporter [Psychromonas arctica]|uniref:MFS transporter n=1 Tax=Psychromonas arctica TaxID=168275 RepID=UPI0003FEC4B0|nr:MFS transporter [Psychromonas arctica]